MKRISLLIVVLLMALITFAACASGSSIPAEGKRVQVNGGSYTDITSAQLNSMLKTKDFLLVNVHIPYEGEIPQTDLFVPYDRIEENLLKFPQDKGAKIVLYCRSGSMSAIAAKTLVKFGFTNIWNIDGGMIEWERKSYELLHTSRPEALLTPKPTAAGFSGGPRIHFEEESIDMGKVPAEQSVGYDFPFKNVGDKPLAIIDTTLEALEGC